MVNKFQVAGTHLQGQIEAHYYDLIKAFGKPKQVGEDKFHFEWEVPTNAGIATIYKGEALELYPQYNRIWSVGGHTSEVVPLIQEILEENLGRVSTI